MEVGLLEELRHGGHRQLGGLPVGEVELPGGDAAEGHAAEVVFGGQLQAGAVAGGELCPVPPGHPPPDDGPHRVEHVGGGEVIAPGELGPGRWAPGGPGPA